MTLPNIVFITCHDTGRHLGCYGQETVVSPNLDRLAAEGVRFANSFCTAPQCSPSRAALHTGRHAHSVGVLGLAHHPFDWYLEPSAGHLVTRLRQLGYHTALFGGQHVTRHEWLSDLGYDYSSGEEAAPTLAQGVRSYLQAIGGSQPFYLELDFTEAHRPYTWGGATPDDSRGVKLPPTIPDHPDAVAEFAALQGAIRQLDEGVDVVLVALDELRLREDTLVVFTTDHGLAMPRAKCTLYDPGIATVLLMRWPAGAVSGGRVFEQLISHVDVAPSLLEALGVSVPAGEFQGRSFWPLLQNRSYQANDAVFAEKTFHTAYEPMRGLRTATYKLILNFESGPNFDVPDDVRNGAIYPLMINQATGHRPHVELYDLEQDPLERTNLAGRPEMMEIETSLSGRLRQWMEETNDPLLEGPPKSP
ncbi:MAG TPA: sulfatase, partial [Anaerolineae bacterium]